MAMNIEQINRWMTERLRRQDGTWDVDVLYCLFHAMEECGPCYSRPGQPTVSAEYIRLVEIGCEYLRDTKYLAGLQRFLEEALSTEFQRGVYMLNGPQRRRFAEQLAWLLNLAEFRNILREYVEPFGGNMPDRDTVALDWQDARSEYKRRLGLDPHEELHLEI